MINQICSTQGDPGLSGASGFPVSMCIGSSFVVDIQWFVLAVEAFTHIPATYTFRSTDIDHLRI